MVESVRAIDDALRQAIRDELRPVLEALAALRGQTAAVPAEGAVTTVAAAAQRYSVTAAWLRSEIRAGRLPALHVGRQLRVRLADVEALMQRAPEASGRSVDELLLARRHRRGSAK